MKRTFVFLALVIPVAAFFAYEAAEAYAFMHNVLTDVVPAIASVACWIIIVTLTPLLPAKKIRSKKSIKPIAVIAAPSSAVTVATNDDLVVKPRAIAAKA